MEIKQQKSREQERLPDIEREKKICAYRSLRMEWNGMEYIFIYLCMLSVYLYEKKTLFHFQLNVKISFNVFGFFCFSPFMILCKKKTNKRYVNFSLRHFFVFTVVFHHRLPVFTSVWVLFSVPLKMKVGFTIWHGCSAHIIIILIIIYLCSVQWAIVAKNEMK